MFRKTITIWLTLAVLICLTSTWAIAGTQIDGGSGIGDIAGNHALGYPGQRKLVRDSDGYWYAVWVGIDTGNKNVYMNKSTNTDGTAWDTPIILFGNGGLIYNHATDDFFIPSMEIDWD